MWVNQALSDQVFAVVDLETTGTRRGQDRIIQFGCAIIKNRQIIKTYSFLINPEADIPQAVQNLTGIKPTDVINQPVFKKYAAQIEDILQDTVFVAHNINFDLPFLNAELAANSFPKLHNRAIDTVELSKIAFPTLPSYRLSDLTHSLNLKHTNPHQADSDAYATASLLLKIFDKLETLPQSTLNTLTSLSKGLLRDTQFIFKEISEFTRQEKRPLPKKYRQVHSLVLKKQDQVLHSDNAKKAIFPKSDEDKKQLFKGKLEFRPAQVNLINKLHAFFNNERKAILVEAPSGTGKSFSYLFSCLYNLYRGQKLVIATPTMILQNQLIEKDLPLALQVSGLDLSSQVVKASRHYLDLDGFEQSLKKKTENQETLILKMKILIWLTETSTGDLDELHTTNFAAPYFAQVQHPGDARVGTVFSPYDFWNLARYRQEQADILITNQAYLANHYQDSIWGQNPYLIVDEAHRFSDIVMNSRNNSLQFESFGGMLSHLRNIILFGEDNIAQDYKNSPVIANLADKADSTIGDVIHAINDLQTYLYNKKDTAIARKILPNGHLQVAVESEAFTDLDKFLQLLASLQNKIEEIRTIVNQLLGILYQISDSFLPREEARLNELSEQVDLLDYYSEQAYLLSDLLNDHEQFSNCGLVLDVTNPADPLATNLNWMLLDPRFELEKIYACFKKIVFISATLSNNGDFSFSKKNLSLTKLDCAEFYSNYNFKLEQQVLALSLVDSKAPLYPSDDLYRDFVAPLLLNSIKKQDKVLVLFTNLEAIADVYSAIVTRPEFKDFELLAQGVTGSNEKIVKRFNVAKRAIILGANSFWEGVDFGQTKVNLVIATKLPFESPDQVEVKLRQTNLSRQGIDVFSEDSLPRAILRLKQGMGRLIRSPKDSGIFALLDQRIWTSNYGPEFLDSLPGRPVQVNLDELEKNIRKGYDKDNVSGK